MAPPAFPFTSYDLDSSIEVPKAIRANGGVASAAELAFRLGYKSANNGAFLTRVANARRFALVEGPSSALRATQLALSIVQPDYPATADRARLEAFESVPLYKAVLDAYHGEPLPDESGMRNALQTRFEITEEKVAFVLTRLMDSAEQAGLFKTAGNRTRMLRPTFTVEDVPPPKEDESTPPPVTPPAPLPPSSSGPRADKMIDGVLDHLPDKEWTDDGLRQWLTFFEDALRIYYKLPRAPHNVTNIADRAANAEGGGR